MPSNINNIQRSGINDKLLEKLIITNDFLFSDDLIQHELIEHPKWLDFPVVYPPHVEFIDFYDIMIEHMKRVWTCVETDLTSDISKFKHAPKSLKSIVGDVIGLFILGDTVVLDNLKSLSLTPNVIRMFLINQTDRENTHQLTYSMWADLLDNADYVRSRQFADDHLQKFKRISDKYQNCTDNRIILFFIMVCEMIFFVPGFQTICYLATTGYAPNLCNANLLVMRDEHIHYTFARTALSKYINKLNKTIALSILYDMTEAVKSFIKGITSRAQHPVLTEDHMLSHLNYVIHQFKSENSLYEDDSEEAIHESIFGTTPAWEYFHLLKFESKINLMESVSTNYKIPGPTSSDSIDMTF